MLKALVLCEVSGIWSGLLNAAGFDVLQVDLGCSPGRRSPGWKAHRWNVLDVPPADWDVVVAFPPCTTFANVGAMHWKTRDQYPALQVLTHCARLCAGARIAGLLENPRGLVSRILGAPSMEVNPWEWAAAYRERYSKRTDLWLWNWPPPMSIWSGDPKAATRSWVRNQPGGRPNNQARRSIGWEGMAAAFVGSLLTGRDPWARLSA
jgi:hypothetical protein